MAGRYPVPEERSGGVYREELKDEIDFWKFLQYKFYQQWGKLRAYANEQGISIIGDIPIYVALDSADVWTHPELFLLDEENLTPLKVAGVPPDASVRRDSSGAIHFTDGMFRRRLISLVERAHESVCPPV